MATMLRPSARQLGRMATTALRSASRGGSKSARGRTWTTTPAATCLHVTSRRQYATLPNSDNSDKNGSNKVSKNEATGERSSESRPLEDGAAKSEQPEPPREPEPGKVFLTAKQLQTFEAIVKRAPKHPDMDAVVQEVKTNGVPVEFAQLLDKAASGNVGLGDAMAVMRAAFKLLEQVANSPIVNDYAEKQARKMMGQGNKNDGETPQQEAKNPKDPGPSDTEQRDPKGASSGFNFSSQKPNENKNDSNQNNNNNNKNPKKMDMNEIFTSIIALALFYGIITYIFPSESSKEITWQELRKNYLEKGLVEKFVVYDDRVRVDLNREAVRSIYPDNVATNPSFNFYFSIGSQDAFERRLEDAQQEMGIPPSERIPVSFARQGVLGGLFMTLLPTFVFVGLIAWLGRRAGGGMGGAGGGVFGMGKSKAKMFNHESAVKVKFSDVAGMNEAKEEIVEFVSFLKSPEKFIKLGAKIPRGAILSGPPGTGKTLLAKATAGESGVPFFSVSGSEFVEMFVGVGASRVRDLFTNARKNAPCIIFIDEIDAIGKSRSESARFGGNDEREATLNQILTEMDGFNTTEQIVVLAGTNRPDILDKALMRPGRFDRQIHIDLPTIAGRVDVFKVYLKKVKTNEDMEHMSGRLAALTPGFSGADIANVVNEAALVAARDNASSIEMKHFEQAIERVIGGLERRSLVLNPEERKTVAYHEAGHAICGWYFEYADPLLKVSIIPRGKGALGYAQYLPTGDAYLMNTRQLMDRMAMTLGGRISEELHFPTVTTGASDDFKKVTNMATTMVTQWGMSEKLGPIHFESGDRSQQFTKPFAESTAQTIDAEVKRIVGEAYKQCKDLLTEKKKEVGIIAEELLKKEMLTRDDMVRLLGPRPFKDKEEFTKYFNDDNGQGPASPPPMHNPPPVVEPGSEGGAGGGPMPSPAYWADLKTRWEMRR